MTTDHLLMEIVCKSDESKIGKITENLKDRQFLADLDKIRGCPGVMIRACPGVMFG